jgi:hypothetical protein
MRKRDMQHHSSDTSQDVYASRAVPDLKYDALRGEVFASGQYGSNSVANPT